MGFFFIFFCNFLIEKALPRGMGCNPTQKLWLACQLCTPTPKVGTPMTPCCPPPLPTPAFTPPFPRSSFQFWDLSPLPTHQLFHSHQLEWVSGCCLPTKAL